MSYETFIAKKVLFGKSGKSRMANPVIRIATLGITLGMAVMIVSVMVVTGFRNEITAKVIGFGAHIRINNFDSNNSYEEIPIAANAPFVSKLKNNPNVKHIQIYATKAGIVKTNEEIQGIVLKGVDKKYDWTFFKDKLVSGKLPALNDSNEFNEVLISQKTANQLQLKAGDDMIVYFIQQPPRIRKFKITGVYTTGLDEFDNLYAFCNIDIIRKLNNWDKTQAGGYEILIHDLNKLDQVNDEIYKSAGFEFYTQSIREQYPQLFHWLDLQNINVIIIIGLILLIAGISMISTLLILILENTAMIGMLKSLGAGDRSIRKIFIYIAVPVIGTGIIAGNILGIGLCLLQWKFGLVTLPQESYYVSTVPVNFSIPHLILLNAGTILACILILIGPSAVISRISPSKVMRFD
ncbi:MAG: ABC transporter permease [Bacteroidetes bacterium]|nr:ABC transporter permease [Bacteroidota bacterium]